MNSLEFIDEEIKFCQAKINKARQDIIYQQTMALLIPENKNIDFALLNNFHISLNETKIKYLHQIKAELEAWYVVKEDIEYQAIKYCDERPEYTYEYKEWSFKLTEDYPNFEEKSEKLKKALEVEKER